MRLIKIILLLSPLLLGACSQRGADRLTTGDMSAPLPSESSTTPPSSGKSLSLQGTIKYLNFEGGFYGILGADGNDYLPLNLDNAFKIDGLAIQFEATVENNTMTIHMWGQPVTLTNISSR